jgi:hypothetical protein
LWKQSPTYDEEIKTNKQTERKTEDSLTTEKKETKAQTETEKLKTTLKAIRN